jgi:HEAT repeat protein
MMKYKTLATAVIAALAIAAHGKEIREDFTSLAGAYESVQEHIDEAVRQAREVGESRFWFGYHFPLRPGINFYNIHIHDDGGISLSSGDGFCQCDAEDDLRTHALHALSASGDEEARRICAERRQAFVADPENWGLFFLVSIDDRSILRLKLFRLTDSRQYQNLPVYWGGEMPTQQSIAYLKKLVRKNAEQRTAEPVLFLLSLHDDPKILPFLTEVAESDRTMKLRQSAVFWISTIPGEESFQALERLYDRTSSREMKERLIFAFSQHQSKKVLGKLVDIARRESDLQLREEAVFWIGQSDDEKALDLLQEMLAKTESPKLKEKIVFSISQYDSERAVKLLIKIAESHADREVREQAIFRLGQKAGQKALEALGDMVENDDETQIKEKAIFAISQHGDQDQAMDMLIEIARTNPNPKLRKTAIFWLSQNSDKRALGFFKEVLTQK